MLEINDKDSNVAETGPPRSEVTETLVTRGVDDEQAGYIDIDGIVLIALSNFFLEFVLGEEGGTNLLGDAAGVNVVPGNEVVSMRAAGGVRKRSWLESISMLD